jgi:serine phosphatase RsbU (regulator of sigma subunit)
MLFVTMFFACIDLKTGVMEFCNCGHNLPVLLPCDGGKPCFLACIPNTVIGVMPSFEFEGQRVDDVRGKVLFIYTDGLNEAENAAHEQFGNEAMLEELGRKAFTDSRSLIEQMGDAVARHVNGAEASDDLTMICVKFNG